MEPPAPTPPTDQQQRDIETALLQRVAAGDKDAFAQLYDRLSRPLYAVALRILNDRAEAEDIVHDAFVALWEKARHFEMERGSAFSWTVTAVRNRAIDRLRSRNRRRELLDRSAPVDLGYADSGAQEADSAEQLWQRESTSAVRRAVAELGAEQRAALELAFFGGLTQQEIAARLQQPLGTVKARIRRGLLKLKDALSPRL